MGAREACTSDCPSGGSIAAAPWRGCSRATRTRSCRGSSGNTRSTSPQKSGGRRDAIGRARRSGLDRRIRCELGRAGKAAPSRFRAGSGRSPGAVRREVDRRSREVRARSSAGSSRRFGTCRACTKAGTAAASGSSSACGRVASVRRFSVRTVCPFSAFRFFSAASAADRSRSSTPASSRDWHSVPAAAAGRVGRTRCVDWFLRRASR